MSCQLTQTLKQPELAASCVGYLVPAGARTDQKTDQCNSKWQSINSLLYYEFNKHLNMNCNRESKMLFNADVSMMLLTVPMGENRFLFSIYDARSLTNIRIVSMYGDYQCIVEIAFFFLFITRITNY